MENKKITKIVKEPLSNEIEKNLSKNKKVAAYARVSSSSAEQRTSLDTQVKYYKALISKKENWDFIEIYYDYGISGLSCKKRDGFNRMVDDALAGKIDLIITKSLSRFARNTVDTLLVLRKLTAAGVAVYFEKENINTLDSDGEFMITLLSSLAQEESRSMSRNITLGHRKRFSDGKYSVAYSHFLGYDRGKDGTPVVNPEEAKIVRLIYRLYFFGANFGGIFDYLNKCNILTPCGNDSWDISTVKRILTNEKYKGDALLQKTYKAHFLDKRAKKNNGEVPQYYVSNGHEAIIPPEIFDLLQEEIEMRKKLLPGCKSKITLNNKVICNLCGSSYMRSKNFWRCRNLYDGQKHCPNIKNDYLEKSCAAVLKKEFSQRVSVIETCGALLSEIRPEMEKSECVKQIFDYVKNTDSLYYDDWLWRTAIKNITVTENKDLIFTFTDSHKIVLSKFK